MQVGLCFFILALIMAGLACLSKGRAFEIYWWTEDALRLGKIFRWFSFILCITVRFQVLTASSMNIAVFWVAVPCCLVDVERRFRDYSSIFSLMMEAESLSETSVIIFQVTRRSIPEGIHLLTVTFHFICCLYSIKVWKQFVASRPVNKNLIGFETYRVTVARLKFLRNYFVNKFYEWCHNFSFLRLLNCYVAALTISNERNVFTFCKKKLIKVCTILGFYGILMRPT
jgi:hypothetical protein